MRKIILLLSVCLMGLTACHDDDNGGGSDDSKTTRTVLIYMAGENNLGSGGYLHDDLKEIVEGSKYLANDQRLFVFVDSLNTSSQAPRVPYIMEVHGGKSQKVYEYDDDFYSCDPAYFQEIIQRVVSMAPSDSYGLVLWGHASGWAVSPDTVASSRATRAYGQDYGTDSNRRGSKWMNITQMAKALEGLPKMEFIFADCCNMMCAEVGYELRNVTNYLMGSPAEIPGDGAPYHLIIPQLYQDNSEQMCRNVIDTYYEYYEDVLWYYSVPLSVIDTRYITQLAIATGEVLDKFTDGYPQYPEYPDLSADGIAYYWHYDTPIMYDMRAFIKTHVSDDVFQQWDKSYQQAVPYYRMSMEWMTIYDPLDRAFDTFNQDESSYGCVSMFIPQNTSIYFNGNFHYNKTFNNYGWNRLIDWSRFGWNEDVI